MSDLATSDNRNRRGGQVVITEPVIDLLVTEPKVARTPLEPLYSPPIEQNLAYRNAEVLLDGASGALYKLRTKQLVSMPLNFSVILTYQMPNRSREFRLRRYNGPGQGKPHRNSIEKTEIRGAHIHLATERYQTRGLEEEHFAIATDRFVTLEQALDCAVADCSILGPPTYVNANLRRY